MTVAGCTDLRTETPGQLLRSPVVGELAVGPELWGFGGAHGGLVLALLASAMTARIGGAALRSITGHFHRALHGPVGVEVEGVHQGGSVTTLSAVARTSRGPSVTAAATFGRAGVGRPAEPRPAPPIAPPPGRCPRFDVPVEFVPITRYLEVRPVGLARPYAGGTVAQLIAWLRLVEDDEPPDVLRLIFLADALAPSYAAVLSAPTAVPTLELTVRPGAGLDACRSPWVLLRATTTSASAGWIDERIDVWGLEREHLGSASQLRIVGAAA